MKRYLTLLLGLLAGVPLAHADFYPEAPTIVWTDRGTGKVQKLALTPEAAVQDVATGWTTPQGLTYNPALGYVYTTDPEPIMPLIRACRLDGTSPGSFSAVGSNPTGIVSRTTADPDKPGVFYDRWLWTDATEGTLYRYGRVRGAESFDPPPTPIVETGLVHPAGLALDNAHDGLFISDPGAGKLWWAKQDGSGLSELLGGLGDPREVVGHTDPDPVMPFVIFTDAAAGQVRRADLAYNSPPSVTGVTDLITAGLVEPTGLALDLADGWLFITDPGSGTIWRSHLDGSGLEPLVTGLSDPWDIIYIVPEPASLALLTLGGWFLRRRRGASRA